MPRFRITRQRFAASAVVILWLCLVADIFTIPPKRVWALQSELQKSGNQKLLELWGGFHVISKELREKGELETKVGLPTLEYSEIHDLSYPYGHVNYNALVYPGRAVPLADEAALWNARPAYILLDKEWPPFTFPGDPRTQVARYVTQPQVVRITYDPSTS